VAAAARSWPQENIIYIGNYRLPEDKGAGRRGGSHALMVTPCDALNGPNFLCK
jgi:hypothetical protein